MSSNGKSANFAENIFCSILYKIFPEKLAKTVFQFLKCGVVGILNTAVDFAVLNALMYITGITSGSKYTLFTGVAFCFAVTNSFIWNKNWTFKSKTKNSEELFKQICVFVLISAVAGLVIKTSTANFVVNIMGPQWGIKSALWANIGNASAVFLTVVWNFIGYKFIVFKK